MDSEKKCELCHSLAVETIVLLVYSKAFFGQQSGLHSGLGQRINA
jgi:hypothetical protein